MSIQFRIFLRNEIHCPDFAAVFQLAREPTPEVDLPEKRKSLNNH
jgi:hypothetical protein